MYSRIQDILKHSLLGRRYPAAASPNGNFPARGGKKGGREARGKSGQGGNVNTLLRYSKSVKSSSVRLHSSISPCRTAAAPSFRYLASMKASNGMGEGADARENTEKKRAREFRRCIERNRSGIAIYK
jgi:hypothetical protein